MILMEAIWNMMMTYMLDETVWKAICIMDITLHSVGNMQIARVGKFWSCFFHRWCMHHRCSCVYLCDASAWLGLTCKLATLQLMIVGNVVHDDRVGSCTSNNSHCGEAAAQVIISDILLMKTFHICSKC